MPAAKDLGRPYGRVNITTLQLAGDSTSDV